VIRETLDVREGIFLMYICIKILHVTADYAPSDHKYFFRSRAWKANIFLIIPDYELFFSRSVRVRMKTKHQAPVGGAFSLSPCFMLKQLIRKVINKVK
jgi:hypothetical protein